MGRTAAIPAALAAACVLAVPGARADGDPASDILLYQRVFLPYYVTVPPTSANELKRVVAEANRRGYVLRVALIGAAGDLGSASTFWRKPQLYAIFLGQELSVLPTATPYKSRVLVVMPNGYGLSKSGNADPAERRALAALQPPQAAREDLGTGGIRAAQALAAAGGVKIAAKIPGQSGGGPVTSLEIVGVAVTLLAVGAALEIARRVRLRRRT